MTLTSRAVAVRTVVVRTTVSAFSLAALMGVVALMAGGAFGATEGRILLTTLLVGVASVLTLCYLVPLGTPPRWVGVTGGALLVWPVLAALLMIWRDYETAPSEAVWKSFGVGAIWAATFAQASLLLALGHRAGPVVRRVLAATLGLAVGLAGLTSALVLGLRPEGGAYLRLLGIVVILDVLGTVVVAALVVLARSGGGRSAAQGPPVAPVRGPLVVPVEQAAVLADLAAVRGCPPELLLGEAVEEYLDRAAGPSLVVPAAGGPARDGLGPDGIG